jgi:hypothetical protein
MILLLHFLYARSRKNLFSIFQQTKHRGYPTPPGSRRGQLRKCSLKLRIKKYKKFQQAIPIKQRTLSASPVLEHFVQLFIRAYTMTVYTSPDGFSTMKQVRAQTSGFSCTLEKEGNIAMSCPQ